jgi:hypothetical protein
VEGIAKEIFKDLETKVLNIARMPIRTVIRFAGDTALN